MIRILIYYFLPALLPILIYLVIYGIELYNAKKHNQSKPKFFSPKLYKYFTISLGIAVLTFIVVFAVMSFRTIDEHHKPKVVDGKLVR